MAKTTRRALLRTAKVLMKNENLTDEIADEIEEQRGGLGFLLEMLKRRPRTFNPYLLKGMSIYREPSALDRKTVELVAVGAATALHCEHCLEAHMNRAVEEGASEEEVLDAILVAAAISESSALSVALRKFRQMEGKKDKK
jgi:AhpD family alkylhydroperoxidase